MFITSPETVAEWFNTKVPGAYRKITSDDLRLMNKCKLIGRYDYYIRQDLETISGILEYEHLQQNKYTRQDKEEKPPTCKICG